MHNLLKILRTVERKYKQKHVLNIVNQTVVFFLKFIGYNVICVVAVT